MRVLPITSHYRGSGQTGGRGDDHLMCAQMIGQSTRRGPRNDPNDGSRRENQADLLKRQALAAEERRQVR